MTQVKPKRDLAAAKKAIRDNGTPIGDEKEGKFASPRWDISQERAFLENLLGQRTSFLLIFFGLVIAGAVNARSLQVMQISILVFGCLVCFGLALAVGRSQKKLDIILDIIKLDPAHPVTVVDAIAGSSGSKRKIIGYVLPWACVIALAVASVISWTGGFSLPESPASNLQPATP